MGWSPLAACRQPLPFEASEDVGFFSDVPASWILVPEGSFALFFPDDVHAPLAGSGRVKKVVLKVAVWRRAACRRILLVLGAWV